MRLILSKTSIKSLIVALAVFAILSIALAARQFTFWLPHWQGDQSQYIAMSMKINSYPALFQGYNLREIDIRKSAAKDEPDLTIIQPVLDRGHMGNMLKAWMASGFSYYDMPIFYKAPLLPIVLEFSHNVIAGEKRPFTVVFANLGFGKQIFKRKPLLFLKTQLWAVIVPLTCSLMTIFLTMLFGLKYAPKRAALIAGFALAINPVSIMTSNRIWTEDLMTVLMSVALFLFYYYYSRNNKGGCFLSGFIFGLAVLTNQKALLILPGLWLFTAITHPRQKWDIKTFLTATFNPYFVFFLIGIVIISYSWFHKIYDTYGQFFYQPDTLYKDSPQISKWLEILRLRPHGIIFYTVGTACISPIFIAGYTSIVRFIKIMFRSIFGTPLIQKEDRFILFLWLWVLSVSSYYLISRTGEYRYLVPVYPAMALLSGIVLNQWIGVARSIFRLPWLGHGIIIALIISSAVWTIPIAWSTIFNERNLIHIPFGPGQFQWW